MSSHYQFYYLYPYNSFVLKIFLLILCQEHFIAILQTSLFKIQLFVRSLKSLKIGISVYFNRSYPTTSIGTAVYFNRNCSLLQSGCPTTSNGTAVYFNRTALLFLVKTLIYKFENICPTAQVGNKLKGSRTDLAPVLTSF